jgi:hypothetical protein
MNERAHNKNTVEEGIDMKPKNDPEALARKKRFVQSLTRSHLSLNDEHFLIPVPNEGNNAKHQHQQPQKKTDECKTAKRQNPDSYY